MEKLEALSTQFEAARQAYFDAVEPALQEAFTDLFNQFPELEAVRWTQYAPHFNDGDACTFSVHEFEAAFTDSEESGDTESEVETSDEDESSEDSDESDEEESDEDDEEGDEDDGEDNFVGLYSLDDKYEPIEKLSIWAGNNPDVFEAMFDNGVEVTVTREGFSVNEYDHD